MNIEYRKELGVMNFQVFALGLNPKTIEAYGPYTAYHKYKELIKDLVQDDFKYRVSMFEYGGAEGMPSNLYIHHFYFDNKGIIETNLTDAFKKYLEEVSK